MIEFLFVLMAIAAVVWTSVNAFRPRREEIAGPAAPEVVEEVPPYVYGVTAVSAAMSADAPADPGSGDSGSADRGGSGTE